MKKKDDVLKVNAEIVTDKERPLYGRGGRNNFGTSYDGVFETDEDKALLQKILREAYEAYKMPRVKSDEELIERLDSYFCRCAEKGITPCVEEMVTYTGYSHSTVIDWEKGRSKGFSPNTSQIIKKAKDFLKIFDAKMVMAGKLNVVAYIFRAKNYYGLKDTPDEEIVRQIDMLDGSGDISDIQKRLLQESEQALNAERHDDTD